MGAGPASLQDELERLMAESSASLAGIHETLQQRIESRRHAEEEERFVQRLSISIASATNASEALKSVLSAVGGLAGWPYGEAWTLRRADGRLQRTVEHHHDTPRAMRYATQSEGFTYPIGVGVPGRVWQERETLFIRDLATETRLPGAEMVQFADYSAVAGIPVLAGREPVAVLVMHLRATGDDDAATAQRLARALARLGPALRQKLVEDELAAVEREVARSFGACSVAGLVMTLAGGQVVDVNDRFMRLYGWSREEAIGRTALDLGLWSSTAERAAVVMRVLERREPEQMACHVRAKDGSLRPVRAVIDVTERAGTRCALVMVVDASEDRRGERDFRGLVDALPSGVAVVRGTRFLYANAALATELGLAAPSDLAGASLLEWLPVEGREAARARAEGPDGSALGEETSRLLGSDGRAIPVECSAARSVVFEGAPAALHCVQPVAIARVRVGSGAVPPPRVRSRTEP
jgi:PAS domain S-box-containing protein